MKIIECIVCPSKVAVIQRSLKGYGVSGMTLTSVLSCGSQKGITEFYRGYSITNSYFIRTKIELLVADEAVHYVVDVIDNLLHTSAWGNGKVMISNIEAVVRIRSFECGNRAI